MSKKQKKSEDKEKRNSFVTLVEETRRRILGVPSNQKETLNLKNTLFLIVVLLIILIVMAYL